MLRALRAGFTRTAGRGAGAPAAGLLFLAALLVTGLIYSGGLRGPLLLDDIPNLSALLDGRGLEAGGWRAFVVSGSGALGRPVAMGSFLFNALTSGNDVAAWKWTNVMLHLLVGVVIFWLSAHLWCVGRRRPDAPCWYVGLLLGAVWLLHPLQVSTVLYTVQRMTQLSALFVFAGLLAYVMGRKAQIEGRAGYVPFASCFLVFLPLAMFSKENGVLLIPLVLVTELCLFRFRAGVPVRRVFATLFALFVALPLVAGLVLLVAQYDELVTRGYLARDFTLGERLLTQFRILFLYIQQLLVPIQQTMGFVHDDIAVSRSLLAPPTTLFSIVGIIGLLVLAWLARRRAPLVGFGILFYFAGHALESSIFPLELAFEHRNYLPSYGVFVALVGAFARFAPTRQLKPAASVTVLLVLATLTVFRVQTWASDFTLLTYTARTHPDSDRVNAVLAERLTQVGRYGKALALLAEREGPGAALQRLYIRCLRDGGLADAEIDAARESFGLFVDHYAASGLMELGRLGIKDVCKFSHERYLRMLAQSLDLTIASSSTRQKLAVYQAQYLWGMNRPEAALEASRRAYAERPDNPIPLLLATEYLLELGRLAEARAEFAKARKVAGESHLPFDELIEEVERKLKSRSLGASGMRSIPDAGSVAP